MIVLSCNPRKNSNEGWLRMVNASKTVNRTFDYALLGIIVNVEQIDGRDQKYWDSLAVIYPDTIDYCKAMEDALAVLKLQLAVETELIKSQKPEDIELHDKFVSIINDFENIYKSIIYSLRPLPPPLVSPSPEMRDLYLELMNSQRFRQSQERFKAIDKLDSIKKEIESIETNLYFDN